MSLKIRIPEKYECASETQHLRALAEHQKTLKQNKISSVLVAVLVHSIILMGLALWVIVSPEPENPEIQVRVSNTPELKPLTKVETKVSNRKPSPPSSSSRLITTATMSEVFVPQVDTTTFEGVGIGDGLGVGLGMGGFGTGGGGGSETVFFNQRASAERVAFVIDYSQSMRGARIELLKSELSDTMKLLADGVDYQLIFFAGPAWTAGDEVKMLQGNRSAVVKSGGRSYDWVSTGGATDWEADGKRQKVEWLTMNPKELEKSLEAIQTTPLVWGTDWEVPLEMALDMEPAPQIVFFMTDGSSGKQSMEIAEKIGRRAKKQGTVVNTISLMEPSTAAAMRELAKRTKGKFTIVANSGETKEENFSNE